MWLIYLRAKLFHLPSLKKGRWSAAEHTTCCFSPHLISDSIPQFQTPNKLCRDHKKRHYLSKTSILFSSHIIRPWPQAKDILVQYFSEMRTQKWAIFSAITTGHRRCIQAEAVFPSPHSAQTRWPTAQGPGHLPSVLSRTLRLCHAALLSTSCPESGAVLLPFPHPRQVPQRDLPKHEGSWQGDACQRRGTPLIGPARTFFLLFF